MTAYDDPASLGSPGPVAVGAAIDRLAAARPAPVAFIALHGPFGEDGTVQALLEAAGIAYTGSGVAASAIGMDKTLFKRLCRGIGLPVVDWREVRADRWAADPASVRTELAAFAEGASDPRLMVKPARLGSSVGMTLVHEPSELDGALAEAFRHDTLALVETYLAGARDLEVAVLGSGAALELFGPGEIVSGHEFYDYAAKYTAGLSETSTRAEVTDAQRATLQKIARDAYRAIGADGFSRVDFLLVGDRIVLVRDQHHPGLHADQPVPDDARRGRLFVRGRVRPDRRSRAGAARRPGRDASHDRGPAAMNGRPVAKRSRTPLPGRRTRPVRRASAGLSAVRAGAALAMLVSAAAIYGVGASSAFDYTKLQLDGLTYTDQNAVEAALASARGENLFGLSTTALVSAIELMPTVRSAQVQVQLPGTLAVTIAERVPVLIWQAGAERYLVDADGNLFSTLGATPPAAAARLPVIDDRRVRSALLQVGQKLDPVDLDAATRLASLVPADIGSSAVGLTVSATDENGFVLGTKPAGWSAVFGFYTPSLRTTDLIPEQVRLLRSLLVGREAQVDKVILASATDGTYTPRSAPPKSPKPSKAP